MEFNPIGLIFFKIRGVVMCSWRNFDGKWLCFNIGLGEPFPDKATERAIKDGGGGSLKDKAKKQRIFIKNFNHCHIFPFVMKKSAVIRKWHFTNLTDIWFFS